MLPLCEQGVDNHSLTTDELHPVKGNPERIQCVQNEVKQGKVYSIVKKVILYAQ
jgi:hypothetical protein